ncbi:MAG: hypothetical protein KF726_05190 [Anaerolineae bacterium]|nr:hypothetical protein [Anaerolineae bacterium]
MLGNHDGAVRRTLMRHELLLQARARRRRDLHLSTGVLESQFSDLRYRAGDYLVIPAGVICGASCLMRMCRSGRATSNQLRAYPPPKRYLNNYGQFLGNIRPTANAIFCAGSA